MERNIYLIIILSFVLTISCTNNFIDFQNTNYKNEILFEDMFLKDNVSPNFFDNHYYLIEKLNEKEILETIKSLLVENRINLNELNLRNITRSYLNNSIVSLISIPYKKNPNQILIYNFNELYQIVVLNTLDLENYSQYSVKTLDGNLFYELSINNNQQIGNIWINSNESINEFSNILYENHQIYHKKETDTLNRTECCRKERNWEACMNCTIEYCAKNWACAVAFGVAPIQVAAAFAASCIGAGPNSVC